MPSHKNYIIAPNNATTACLSPLPIVTAPILRLPRELRDMIYKHYLRVHQGYVYDFEANKLRQADGKAVCLALSATCQQIASEMKGVALNVNTITFSTYYSERTKEQAGLLHAVQKRIATRKFNLLNQMAHKVLTDDTIATITASFQQFGPVLEYWRVQIMDCRLRIASTGYGEAPSIWRDFINFTLDVLSKQPNFHDAVETTVSPHQPYHAAQALRLAKTNPKPWVIPSTIELEQLLEITPEIKEVGGNYYPNTKFAYSAASVAIRFLSSMTIDARRAIRNIILQEDSESVANPSHHGRGFIPFCQENRKLYVHTMVSLWQNAFPIAGCYSSLYTMGESSSLENSGIHNDCLPADKITKAVGAWIAETLVLPSLGMPRDSYKLILDGNPTKEYTTDVFRVVQRDVAWQSALEASHARGLLPKCSWIQRRLNAAYMYRGLPEAIQNLQLDASIVNCNFNPGS